MCYKDKALKQQNVLREYVCDNCGKRFNIHCGGTFDEYVYKIEITRKNYEIYCSWSCHVKGKTRAVARKLTKQGDLVGYSDVEAENWAKWVGVDIPKKEEATKSKYVGKETPARITCYDRVKEKYEHLTELKKEGYIWKEIRIMAGLNAWSVPSIVNAYNQVCGEINLK